MVVAATLTVFLAVALTGLADLADSDQPTLARVTVSLAAGVAPVPIPRSYLGLSTEYWALPLYAHQLTLFERVLRLAHVPANGPMILRVGGDSADHSFWDPDVHRLPPWAFSLSPQWTQLTSHIVRTGGLRLIIDLNLITDTPARAAAWAKAARAYLPRASIVGFEIGNEPDLYSHSYWGRMTAGRLVASASLPAAITARDYVRDFRAYSAALASVAPRVRLIGPALSHPVSQRRWITQLLAARPRGLGMISVHRYPYSACLPPWSSRSPTVQRLLSDHASTGQARQLAPVLTAARGAGLPVRLTELNSVTCGGRPGVSDTFATALWAPATLLALLQAGADGVNVHVRANTINAPFALSARGLSARPLLYGLIMAADTLSGGVRLLPLHLTAPRATHVSTWAVQTRLGALHVLVIDRGRIGVRVALRLPGHGGAVVQRLQAASPRARSGVRLGGQRLGTRGQWLGRASRQAVARTRRGYVVDVPRFSAALVTVPR